MNPANHYEGGSPVSRPQAASPTSFVAKTKTCSLRVTEEFRQCSLTTGKCAGEKCTSAIGTDPVFLMRGLNIPVFEDFRNVGDKNRLQKRVFREKLTLDTSCRCFRSVFRRYLAIGKSVTILEA